MCGIAGIFHYAEPDRPVDRELLARMTRALLHRGPDDEGFFVDGPMGLGHRRLAIVDLSPAGHQPMSNQDGSCWISYNGEFYNHAGYRRRLQTRGHVFRGTSDTETLLHLLEQEGPDCLAGLAGIFAFAFWDRRRRCLTLGRDPLGVKQLYYHDDGRRIVFASEIKALLECDDVPRRPDPQAINQYLHLHTALFERTFFQDIRQVRAGQYLRISTAGVVERTYFRLEDFTPRGGTAEENVEALREQLASVVGEQLMSDVPVGSFFSGGIDSSAVAAFAARAGKRPQCFGVHFQDRVVTDEEPYQHAAAKALGLDLELITVDGASFPDDLSRLMYFQDEPVIGPAMIPMYYVSRLASRHVKVCLGGQAADEIFGGYARYALVRPGAVVKSWFSGRHGIPGPAQGGQGPEPNVSGNLWRQFADRRTLRRLAANLRNLGDWRSRYFDHFARVPEKSWQQILDGEIVSRSECRQIFEQVLERSPSADPADQVMHWDMQTYLTGLFHQDDRMSMAASLESRVPLADPRLVAFAFRCGFDLKFHGGASKWILRQAVADVLPDFVLNRRKVGFDTPLETWICGRHAAFVRETLLSGRARERGLWHPAGLEKLLGNGSHGPSIELVWKALCIEVWAQIFLDRRPAPAALAAAVAARPSPRPQRPETLLPRAPSLANAVQELREMGLRGALCRARWELKTRSGLLARLAPPAPELPAELARELPAAASLFAQLPLADPGEVATAMRRRFPGYSLEALARAAREASRGRIRCFGCWQADYGLPIDWHRNPASGKSWPAQAHWSQALREEPAVGDIKMSWEVARFPHSFLLARAAAFKPALAAELEQALLSQLDDFVRRNPYGRGVHWNSGQEIAFRMIAWCFGLHVFACLDPRMGAAAGTPLQGIYQGAAHIERYLEFARDSVPNNHLLSEALGLYLAGVLLAGWPGAQRWQRLGRAILEEQADRQLYPDGAYIQQSHNYHRVAMQIYLWAWSMARSTEEGAPETWRKAMERSLEFLTAHQNPIDGRLPNYGANDGAMPLILSTCGFSDFRPTLQALSIVTRGERIYEPGRWDECAAWLCGPAALALPLRPAARRSVSFAGTGYHVLRGEDPSNFGAFRCGSLSDRYSQIDMLHLDVWWRGHNVLIDGGSYLYNGPEEIHHHFLSTGSHNTVQIDGRDQMLHYRRFKCLYHTKARLTRFAEQEEWAACEGEHYGYRRLTGGCVHGRSVVFIKDDLWIVVDRITGSGKHRVRLHWLGGEFPHDYDPEAGCMILRTPSGPFSVTVCDAAGNPLAGDCVAGRETPPRGWHSRYYGEKRPAPSLAVEVSQKLPVTLVSVLCEGVPEISAQAGMWSVRAAERWARFRMEAASVLACAVDAPVEVA